MSITANYKSKSKPLICKRKAIASAVAMLFTVNMANANPTGATVVNGKAVFSTNGSTLTISNTPNTIINWLGGFNIAKGETVRFIQHSAASAVLNRVTNGNPSLIMGSLLSNGKVFLINQAGILFGKGASVNVAGLVASSLNLSDADFLAGRYNFNANTNLTGNVVNEGNITTKNGGFVYIIGINAENSGVITTPSGEAILAAGNSVELVDSTDPLQRVVVSATSRDVNLSQIMTAADGNIFNVLNSGTVSANTVVQDQAGKVYFKSVGNVTTTATSLVEAKGTTTNNGGFIQAYANKHGSYAGDLVVSGANGGFVETSGKSLDIYENIVNAKALTAGGKSGTWLIDPDELTVIAGATGVISDLTDPGVVTIGADFVESILATGTAVTLDATGSFLPGLGNVNINADISYDNTATGGANTLTIQANHDVIFNNATISDAASTDTLNINIIAGLDTIVGGNLELCCNAAIDIKGTATIRTRGDTLTVPGSSNNGGIHMPKTALIKAGTINLDADGDIYAVTDSVNINAISRYGENGSAFGNVDNAGEIDLFLKSSATNIVADAYKNNDVTNSDGSAVSLYVDSGVVNGSISSNAGVLKIENFFSASNLDLSDANINNNYSTGNLRVLAGGDITGTVDTVLNGHDVEVQAGTNLIFAEGIIGATNDLQLTADNMLLTDANINANNFNMKGNNLTLTDSDLSGGGSGNISVNFTNNATLVNSSINSTTNMAVTVGNVLEADNSQLIANQNFNGAIKSVNLRNSSRIQSGSALNLKTSQVSLINTSSLLAGSDLGINYSIPLLNSNVAKDLNILTSFGDLQNQANIYIESSGIEAGGNLGIAANNITLNAGYIGTPTGGNTPTNAIHIVAQNDITLNAVSGNSEIRAQNGVLIETGGNLTLNSGGASTSARVESINDKIYLNFPLKSAGGYFVDGVEATSQSRINPNSGFFAGGLAGVIGVSVLPRYGSFSEILAIINQNIVSTSDGPLADLMMGDENADASGDTGTECT